MIAHLAGPGGGHHADFARAPFIVLWEITRACDLVCVHCRAQAQPARDPGELTTTEALGLLSEIRRFGTPVVVLTGGDPIKRPDVLEIIRHGARIGLRVAMTPSGTPLMTRAVLGRVKDAGLSRLAVSLDGPTAASHDAFRGVAGSFEWSLAMLEQARALGLSTQVNTTITRTTVDDFLPMERLVAGLGIALWSIFFLVPVGRGRAEDLPSAGACEEVFAQMYRLSRVAPFDVKSTAAPHFRRYILQRQAQEAHAHGPEAFDPRPGPPPLADAIGRAAHSVNDANGLVFVGHTGDICPSGFLPVSAGNVRTASLVDVYRESPFFKMLRDYGGLKGKCGVCPFRWICGGSRARARALMGDSLESDPLCAYVPPAYTRLIATGRARPPEEYFAAGIERWHARCRVAGDRAMPGVGEPAQVPSGPRDPTEGLPRRVRRPRRGRGGSPAG